MRRLLKPMGGGILIMAVISASWLLIAALTDHMASDPWPMQALATALFWALAWPLHIFQPLFPGDPQSLSPDTPTPAAVLATLLFDLIMYSLVAYGLAVLFGRVMGASSRSVWAPHLALGITRRDEPVNCGRLADENSAIRGRMHPER